MDSPLNRLRKSLLVFSLHWALLADNVYQQMLNFTVTVTDTSLQMQAFSNPLPAPLIATQGYIFVPTTTKIEQLTNIQKTGYMTMNIPIQVIPQTILPQTVQLQLTLLSERLFGTGYTSGNFYQNQLLPILVKSYNFYQYGQLNIDGVQAKNWYGGLLGLILSSSWKTQNLIGSSKITKKAETINSLSFQISRNQAAAMPIGTYWFQAILNLTPYQEVSTSTLISNLEYTEATLEYLVDQIKSMVTNPNLTPQENKNLINNQKFLEQQIADIQQTIHSL